MHSGLPHSGQAPTFPSLIAEGTAGGYDVKIPLRPVALFLQFKIPQVVRRGGNQMPNGFSTPYLRMHLRTKQPNQHGLLLEWEASGHDVYYVTPDFWEVADLDEHYSNRQVHVRSRYVRPSAIGVLNDRPHHVAYQAGNHSRGLWRCSRPTRIAGEFGAEKFTHAMTSAMENAKEEDPLPFLNRLASEITEITGAEISKLPADEGTVQSVSRIEKDRLARMSPQEEEKARLARLISKTAREVAYASQVRLGCTFAVLGANELPSAK